MLLKKEEQYLIKLVEKAKDKCKTEYDIEIESDLDIQMDKTIEENRIAILSAIKKEKEQKLGDLEQTDNTNKKEKIVNPFKSIERKQYLHILKQLPDSINLNDAGKDLDYDGLVGYCLDEYGITIPQHLSLKEAKEQFEAEETKIEKENLLRMKEEEKKVINNWKQQFNPDMIIKSPAYFEMEKYIEMVVSGFSNFCVIQGNGGLGKSFSTHSILKKKLKENYAYLNSFTTPLELYNFLYDNSQEKVILLDDVEGVFDNNFVISLLKNACELNKDRTISWNSTTSKLDGRATTSKFTSRIILLINKLPNLNKNPHIQALLNRAFISKLNFSYNEKLDIIKEVSLKQYQNIQEKDRREIYEFIERNTSEATQDLSIRSLIKCYHFFMFNKELWKELAGRILKADPRKEIVLDLMKSGKSVKEQLVEYYERTGFSRPDYFRIKRSLSKTTQEYPKAK